MALRRGITHIALVAVCVCLMMAPCLGGGSNEPSMVVPEDALVSPLHEDPSSVLVEDPVTIAATDKVSVTVNETIKVPFPTPAQEAGHAIDSPAEQGKAHAAAASYASAPPPPPVVYGDSRDVRVTKQGRLNSGPGNRRRTGDGFGRWKSLPTKSLTPREVDKIEGNHKMLKDAWHHQSYQSGVAQAAAEAEEKAVAPVLGDDDTPMASGVTPYPEEEKPKSSAPYVSSAHVYTKQEREEEEEAGPVNAKPDAAEEKKIVEGHGLLEEGFKKSKAEEAAAKVVPDLPKLAAETEAAAAVARLDGEAEAKVKAVDATGDANAQGTVTDSSTSGAHVASPDCGGCKDSHFCVELTQDCLACPTGEHNCDTDFATDDSSRQACERFCTARKALAALAPTEDTDSCTGEVSLFQHNKGKGWQAKFPLGEYPLSAFKAMGAKNNDASSIEVPVGCQATLYQHGHFTGWKAVFPPGEYTLKEMTAKGAKNDDASSIIVVDQPAQ